MARINRLSPSKGHLSDLDGREPSDIILVLLLEKDHGLARAMLTGSSLASEDSNGVKALDGNPTL